MFSSDFKILCFRLGKKEIRVLLRSSMLLRDVDESDECTMSTVRMYLVACICELLYYV